MAVSGDNTAVVHRLAFVVGQPAPALLAHVHAAVTVGLGDDEVAGMRIEPDPMVGLAFHRNAQGQHRVVEIGRVPRRCGALRIEVPGFGRFVDDPGGGRGETGFTIGASTRLLIPFS